MRGSALAALATDLFLGEPPAAAHPTVWMGSWISRGRSGRRSTEPTASLIEGAALVASGALLTGVAAFGVDRVLAFVPGSAGAIVQGLALKPTIAIRGLMEATREVETALRAGRIDDARRALSWHLVSRDTSTLSAGEIAAAAIESLAENFNDALVAPLVAFRIGGLTGAYVFRFINTADAMLGYHTDELEWFGKAAARLDDVAGIVPARLSGLLIAVGAAASGESGRRAISTMLRDAGVTESPNAGWPMAAMAGALDVRLEKRDHYALNAAARMPVADDIARARRIVLIAATVSALLADVI